MAPALWVLAVFSTITVIHRIRYTYLETERRKALASAQDVENPAAITR